MRGLNQVWRSYNLFLVLNTPLLLSLGLREVLTLKKSYDFFEASRAAAFRAVRTKPGLVEYHTLTFPFNVTEPL